MLDWLLSKRQEMTNVDKGVDKGEPLCTINRNVNWCSLYGKQYGGSSKTLAIELLYEQPIQILSI